MCVSLSDDNVKFMYNLNLNNFSKFLSACNVSKCRNRFYQNANYTKETYDLFKKILIHYY